MAGDLIAEICATYVCLASVAKHMSVVLTEHGSRLTEVDGVGPVLAARVVGRVGGATRVPAAASFASYAGAAPIEIASGDRERHRLARWPRPDGLWPGAS